MYFVPHEGDFKLKIVHLSLQFDYVHVVIQFLCVLKTYGLYFLFEQFSIVLFWSQPNQTFLRLVFQREN